MTADRPSRSAPVDERELELRYTVTDEPALRDLLALSTLAGFECGPWRELAISDRYLDTPSRALAAGGYGARVRRLDGRNVVAVKKETATRPRGRNASRALSDRLEVEAPSGPGLDPRRWPVSAARSLIEAASRGEPLRTQFVIDQRREERDLVQDGEVVARLSLDAGVVSRFGRERGGFTTLEIEAAPELADDRRLVLDQLAAVLDDVSALRPEPRSKELIARQVIEQPAEARRRVRPPRKPGVAVDDPLSEAGRKVLRMHVLRMLAAEPGVRAGRDPEAVHKMRVATRRMRAAWRTFEGAYKRRLARRYVDELRTVAAALGAVRDQDVQLERLAAYRASAVADADADAATVPEDLEPLDVLVAAWQTGRDAARVELIDLLDSDVYDRFTSDYLDFVDTPAAGAAGNERVTDVAGGRIWRAYELLRAHDSTVPWADTTALHAVRIDAKRFRYALEFFREVLEADADRVIADVTALQDHLGNLNDAHISAELTRAFVLESGASLTAQQREAAGAYLQANESEVARLTRTFAPLWRGLTSRTFRRRLGGVIAGL